MRQALNHPLRRQIVRTLNDSSARTTGELRETLPVDNLAALHYHVLVLERAEVIRSSEAWNEVDAQTRSYVTEVATDAAVASLLKATQPLDEISGSAESPSDRN